MDTVTFNAPLQFMEVVVQQPQATEIYYGACGKIDQHNRMQQNLGLERKIRTQTWWRRVNMSIFGMCVVDSYLLMVGCHGFAGDNGFRTSRDYFNKLEQQLIENKYDQQSFRKQQERAERAMNTLAINTAPQVLDTTQHLTFPTPTKKVKKANPQH